MYTQVPVAVAIIFNKERNKVLLTRRPFHVHQGGLWEFPGGKLEANEQPEQALRREIQEELDLLVLDYQFLGTVPYGYADKCFELLIFAVFNYAGTPRCCEAQLALHWANVAELEDYDFPAANRQIIQLIKRK